MQDLGVFIDISFPGIRTGSTEDNGLSDTFFAFSEPPAIYPEDLSAPTLVATLSGLASDDTDCQRQALHNVLSFFTLYTPSPSDWRAFRASCFFAMIEGFLANEADCQLVVCCMNSALSQALSSFPELNMDDEIYGSAPSLLALFGAATSADKCLQAYFDIGAAIMALTHNRELADAILIALSDPIVSHLQNSEFIDVLPDLWWLIHEWFSCVPVAEFPDIEFVIGPVVPAISALQSGDFQRLTVNLILVIRDACEFIDGFAAWAVEYGFPHVLREIIVASTQKRLTRASVELLYHLAGMMTEGLKIEPVYVDALLNQVPELANEIFDVALHGLASESGSDPGLPQSEEYDASRPAHQECCVSLPNAQEFWDQRAVWARKHLQDSPIKFSVSVRCFYEAIQGGGDLLARVDHGALIPGLCEVLLSDPSHEERMRAVSLLLEYSRIHNRSVCAFLQRHCDPVWFEEMKHMAPIDAHKEDESQFQECIEELFREIDIDLDLV
jgi:hypothetical protein